MKKILICDIDSTINNHWKRIEKWSKDTPNNEISWKAFTMKELMKDDPLPNSQKALSELSKKYTIHFLTARGFNAYKKGRIFPEKFYNLRGGYLMLKTNNYLSMFCSLFINKKEKMKNKYAFSITEKWLKNHGFLYDELIVVNNIYDKIKILKDSCCDLYIDDMSWGQNHVGPYKNLYDDFILELDRININYEIFNNDNNWLQILKKYK
tara:strand:+ start:140 stop:766 length:627 start_codon:yes stop_codon:yes gene_type:complete